MTQNNATMEKVISAVISELLNEGVRTSSYVDASDVKSVVIDNTGEGFNFTQICQAAIEAVCEELDEMERFCVAESAKATFPMGKCGPDMAAKCFRYAADKLRGK